MHTESSFSLDVLKHSSSYFNLYKTSILPPYTYQLSIDCFVETRDLFQELQDGHSKRSTYYFLEIEGTIPSYHFHRSLEFDCTSKGFDYCT